MAKDNLVFDISSSMSFFGRQVANHPKFWRKLGNIETSFLADALDDISVDRPVYVTGLARSGSTILLETLAALPQVATHRYKDFPPVYTPYWWDWFLKQAGGGDDSPKERAHKDGIMVTHDSPEAMEEVIWMGSFPDLHNPSVNNILDPSVRNEVFDKFYLEHIRKLLLTRGASRYVSKGNYLISRIGYLQALIPDARFIIPVRHPVAHIASLMKQHRLFIKGQEQNPAARMHLKRVGHMEFGLDLAPINLGDDDATRSVSEMIFGGDEVRGWARYWNQVYSYLGGLTAGDSASAGAMHIVRYEDFCEAPAERINEMLGYCALSAPDGFVEEKAAAIKAPTYYKPDFSNEELAIIEEETAEARAAFGY